MKIQILDMGKPKVNIDKIKRFTKKRYPYFTEEVFLSIFIAILLHTNKAKIKSANEAIKKYSPKKVCNNAKRIMQKRKEVISIMNTVKGRFVVPVKHLLHFSQVFGDSY